jgi:hypothetical protein
MKTSASFSLSLGARRTNLPFAATLVIALSVVLAMFFTDTADEILAYLLVTIACAAPIALWVWGGALGIPVMPAVAAMYFVYFGVPILRNNTLKGFGSLEILSGAAMVALFLVAATIVWWLIVWKVRRASDATPSLISGPWINRIVLLGLALGTFFHVSVYSGVLIWLGPFSGLFRSAMLSFAILACFMLGHARALGTLRGNKWVLAIACLIMMILLSWLSLFLVGGMLYCLSAVLGYVITGKRMPWQVLSAAMIVITILNAGKAHMREKYWPNGSNYSLSISALDMPAIMGEWAEAGLAGVFSGRENYTSAVDRASLSALLLRVQRLVPAYVPFLDGASYALLPQMLVPRFLDPDKIASQASMNLLNMSAGFQTAEGASKTAIGWGLLAEAYFNYGYYGVIMVSLLFGLFCGFLERWTIGAQLFSLPCLVAVTALLQVIDLELDAAGLVTALFQSVSAVSAVFWFVKLLVIIKRYPAPRIEPQKIAQLRMGSGV